MKTAEEMYNYCVNNNYGSGVTRRYGIRHFGVIERNLRPSENVLMTFMGLANYKPPTKHDNNYAYAITDERVILGQKTIFGENIKSVVLDRFNDISSTVGPLMGIVTLDTIGDKITIGVNNKTASNISKKAHEIIFNLRDVEKDNTEYIDTTLEIRKYKDLLDEGIITKEEFEIKKKELLGL